MTKRKTRRSRCASDTCGKQFRHADPNAATCSPACRQRVSRISRKAKQEKREHDEKYERMAAAVGKQMALAEAERQAAERERKLKKSEARDLSPTIGEGGSPTGAVYNQREPLIMEP